MVLLVLTPARYIVDPTTIHKNNKAKSTTYCWFKVVILNRMVGQWLMMSSNYIPKC